MTVTADKLLNGVKRRAVVPNNQIVNMSDTDILELLDDVIKTEVVPMVDSVNGEYFVTVTNSNLVASQSEYSIPYRAMGRVLRDLKIENNDSGDVRNCPYIEPENIQDYVNTSLDYGHYFKGNKFVAVPDIPSTYSGNESWQIWYKIRPSLLVKLSDAAKVSSITETTVVVETVGNIVTGSVVDFIQGGSGNSILGIDVTCTDVTGTTFTFALGDIPTDLAVGDYVSIAETSPVLTMVPDECSPWIEKNGAREVLLAIGDDVGADKLLLGIQRDKENLLSILQPRNEGEPKYILNRNSLYRGGSTQRRYWTNGGI